MSVARGGFMRKQTIRERMLRSIAMRKGEVVMRSDFQSMGSASQISRGLKDLLAAGIIVRLGYGVYAKARTSSLSGKPVPRVTLEELAQETLIKLGVDVRLGRAQREYLEGRTTQIPVHACFDTADRRISRKLIIGKRVVRYENNFQARA